MVNRMDNGAVTQTRASTEKTAPTEKIVVAPVEVIEDKAQQQPDNEHPLQADKAKQMTESMNNFLETANTHLQFKFHEKLNEYYVTIVDSTTDEVIKEIPSKKLMDIHAAMREFIGLLVDRKI
ncbi:flagellar protein FlaG [Filibacter tadaridae]|uniref:Flagellar protein FlaG n=1 Tax=Filibacter tadaridae TaxID=2483811 RepID=A0A3P5WW36_9BACL|nr:flagellar protein FlaG [Filibacter tadaridae]VDC27572.1 flagellar protein FlaG [Filibacter tadaridae]